MEMPRSHRTASRLKLRNLEVFMMVASAGTMGRAAAELAVSQPVISKAIADLEYALGVRLFDRSRRGVELTEHGHSLHASGIAVFDELKQSVARLEALNDPTVGEVRIGSTVPLAGGLVSAAVNRMCARYPRMKFHVVEADRNTLRTRDLAARNIDFAVVHILEPFSTDEFAVEVLTDDAYIVYVGRNSKWAKRRNVRLADLVNERWVLPPLGQILAPLHKAFDAAGLERPRATVMTLSVHVHNSLLATGRFVTALPRATFGWGATYLPIKALKIEMPTTGGPIAIVTLRGRKLSGAANLFLDCLRELVAQREKNKRSR
ncbi:MAG: LysR family transcriptional regulator [Xanthobacteraceae bacterium]